jgi:two-component system, OmpR family, sensor histidine kinase MprB
MKMSSRISLLAACAVGLSVAVASLAAYVTLRHELHGRMDQSLLSRAESATHSNLVSTQVFGSIPASWLGAADIRIFLIYGNGTIVSASDGSPGDRWLPPLTPAELRVARGQQGHVFSTINDGTTDLRSVTVRNGNNSALMFVQSTEPIERTLDRMAIVLLFVGISGVLAAALIGLAVARSALQPVRRLSAAAEHIARTDELRPIPITGDDELASLAASFNDMLAALAASRERQRRLVADAGHELRTPLTSLRTNLELLAQADRRGGFSPEQRDELLTDVTAQVEELSTLVGDLVELARDEPLERTPEPVDMADIVARAVDRVRRRADVRFEVSTQAWWVVGEAQVLERAVTNLLDNAAKWSPPNGTVTVDLSDGVLTVADEGPGVAENDLPMIFERFYRAENARRMPGSGLGLSIVRQAAERHGGKVRAANRTPVGAVFSMWLPGQPTQISTGPGAQQVPPPPPPMGAPPVPTASASAAEPVATAPSSLSGAPATHRIL